MKNKIVLGLLILSFIFVKCSMDGTPQLQEQIQTETEVENQLQTEAIEEESQWQEQPIIYLPQIPETLPNENSKQEEPIKQEPINNEKPVIENPVNEEPINNEKPVIENPVNEEPKQEDPVNEEPINQTTIFEGKWITQTKDNVFATIEFAENVFTFISRDMAGTYFKVGTYSGLFTFTENKITLVNSPSVKWELYYSFKKNGTLSFETIGGDILFNSGFEILEKIDY